MTHVEYGIGKPFKTESLWNLTQFGFSKLDNGRSFRVTTHVSSPTSKSCNSIYRNALIKWSIWRTFFRGNSLDLNFLTHKGQYSTGSIFNVCTAVIRYKFNDFLVPWPWFHFQRWVHFQRYTGICQFRNVWTPHNIIVILVNILLTRQRPQHLKVN